MCNCIFCKIINKEIPANILYEDDHVLAILDISQATKGHTLIIPKTHAADVFEMTEQSMAHVYSVIPKIATALKTTFNAPGINILNNNGPVAGQIIFHYHVHLIPRYDETDTFKVISANHGNDYTLEMLSSMKDDILKNM